MGEPWLERWAADEWELEHLTEPGAYARGMDLGRFDLNLLLVFEAVYHERNVTRAADRRLRDVVAKIDLQVS